MLQVPLSPELAARLAAAHSQAHSQPVVSVEVLLANGTVPEVYCALSIVMKRKLPISSAHGGSPMRLAVYVVGTVFCTNPFFVGSKGSKPLVVKSSDKADVPSPQRLAVLAAVGAAVSTAPVRVHSSLAVTVYIATKRGVTKTRVCLLWPPSNEHEQPFCLRLVLR